MTKLAIFREEASVGDHVTLRLTRGEDVSGRIEHLGETYVRLDLGGRTFTVFEDILAGWEVNREGYTNDKFVTSNKLSALEERPGREPRDAERQLTISKVQGDTQAHTATPEVEDGYQDNLAVESRAEDTIVLSELARIKAAFSEAIKRARLEAPEPDFEFPEADFPADAAQEVRREWNRAKSQYDYAQKIKELGRLSSVVAQVLAPLAKRYPNSASTRSLLGRVLMKLNRPEAKEHLTAASALSDAPAHWLALASASGNDTAVECYALRRYFTLAPPQQANDAWFRYLAVAIKHHDLRRTAQVIQEASEQQKEDANVNRLLSESVIYLLSTSSSETLALRASASLVHGAGELPSGWENEFDRSPALSQEVLDVEHRLTRPSGRILPTPQPLRPKESNPVPHGRITSFGNQGFGFIQAHSEDMFFFRLDNVADGELERALLDGNWRTFGEVEFDIRPSQGHKYQRASNIIRLRDSEALLQNARKLLEVKQHTKAMALVRRVLGAEPTDETAHQLEEEIKDDIRKRGIGLPKGNGAYARAKRAQFVDQDLEAAEKLLKQAIRLNDKPESAIKDLASLLQQQGRAEDAITLLESSSSRRKVSSYDNMLATQYQHANRHDDAIRILKRLMESATKSSQTGPLLKRMALSYFKCAKYEDAERVLEELLSNNPNDQTAARWLASLEDARSAGDYAEAEEIIGDLGGLVEEGVGLSSLARAAIKHCTYEGVDATKVQAGSTSNRDVVRVEELAKQLGTKRPRDRAAYYLSAAALLERDPGDGGPGRIYAYLRRYFASMADASWIEKKPADVVRSYYIESLALVDGNLDLNEAWRSLLRYLSTFSTGRAQDIEATIPKVQRDRQNYIGALQKTLEMITPQAGADWLEGLLVVGSQSSFAKDRLCEAFQTSTSLEATFADLLDSTNKEASALQATWQSRCRGQARSQQRRLSICRTLTKYQATVASMEELGKQLGNAFESTTSELDRRRLNALRDISDSALDFCRASDFEEKERNYWLVTTQVDRFMEEVIDAPTQYSHEGLLPVAEHLKSLIEEEYAQMARTSGAELNLKLLVDEYIQGPKGELRLQIEVSNKRGCSPASSIRICLGPEHSEYFAAEHMEREAVAALRGGDTVVTQMEIHPKAAAADDRAFPINALATYHNRLGEEKRTEQQAWTVRLYQDEEFQHIENSYAPFAEGGPVEDAAMFVGRDELLTRLKKSLLSGSGSKSIVVFGQKRAGKSSLIVHLRRRLARMEGIIPVSFSLQDLAPELSVSALLHRILQGVSEVLEDLRFEGKDVPDFSPPGIGELESHATLRFHEVMSSLVRGIARHSSVLNVVLLVDEFTDVFKEIRKGRIPREFMKAWKAIIEKGYFASVLVGQDIMPAFKASFPNEFGVTEDVRVTYLDEAAATNLVQKPIGEGRFAGHAVRRLLDLTAGSPFYTMMFCARLVDYMNSTRSVIVTEADILAVEEEMLRGDRRLTRDKFDNLLSAGDGAVDSGIDPDDTYSVCLAIAQGSENDGWCSRDHISGFDGTVLDKLLADLETRDVVERKGTTYRLRVGLFRDWLVRQES